MMKEKFQPAAESAPPPQSPEKNDQKSKFEKITDKVLLWGSIAAIAGTASLGIKIVHESRESLKPENYIEYTESKIPLNGSERLEMLNKIDFLQNQFSKEILPHLKQSDLNARESAPLEPTIEGFQEKGAQTEVLRRIWSEQNYPKGTIENNIKSISYSDLQAAREYDQGFNHTRSGEADNREYTISLRGWLEKDLTVPSPKDRIQSLDWAFSHELGHLNDWGSARDITPEQRVDFLVEVTKAFDKEGSFRDFGNFVDKIDNPDPKKEKYYKVSEWWGTLSEYYFTFPDILREKNPDNFKLAHKWLSRQETTFNPEKAKADRDSIIERMIKE